MMIRGHRQRSEPWNFMQSMFKVDMPSNRAVSRAYAISERIAVASVAFGLSRKHMTDKINNYDNRYLTQFSEPFPKDAKKTPLADRGFGDTIVFIVFLHLCVDAVLRLGRDYLFLLNAFETRSIKMLASLSESLGMLCLLIHSTIKCCIQYLFRRAYIIYGRLVNRPAIRLIPLFKRVFELIQQSRVATPVIAM